MLWGAYWVLGWEAIREGFLEVVGGGLQIVPVGVGWVEEGRKGVPGRRNHRCKSSELCNPRGLVGLLEFMASGSWYVRVGVE